MKYVCFGYYDKGKFEGMTESETAPMQKPKNNSAALLFLRRGT